MLHGLISPLEGVGPDDIRVAELLRRMQGPAEGEPEEMAEQIGEVILAMSPSVDGEATALYLTKLLKPLDVTGHADRERGAHRVGPGVHGSDDAVAGAAGAARAVSARSIRGRPLERRIDPIGSGVAAGLHEPRLVC